LGSATGGTLLGTGGEEGAVTVDDVDLFLP
jgi:hypothetical protein